VYLEGGGHGDVQGGRSRGGDTAAPFSFGFVDGTFSTRPQVLMEAVFQECFEREITKAERNINNKARSLSCRTRFAVRC
jgi:hypothetical protein